jgi:hypothetical protein
MNQDEYTKAGVIKVASAMYATLLWPFVTCLGSRNWSEKMAVALVYSSVLALSGWVFAITASRIAGFIHAALMLGMAGFCFYVCLGNLNAPLADNPAAGMIAVATLAYFIVGALAAIFGIGAGSVLFGKSPPKDR